MSSTPYWNREDVTLLYHYDGPISGACLHSSRPVPYWFQAVEMDDMSEYPNLCQVFDLSQETWDKINEIETLFRTYVVLETAAPEQDGGDPVAMFRLYPPAKESSHHA